jgi:hypothetical protein
VIATVDQVPRSESSLLLIYGSVAKPTPTGDRPPRSALCRRVLVCGGVSVPVYGSLLMFDKGSLNAAGDSGRGTSLSDSTAHTP